MEIELVFVFELSNVLGLSMSGTPAASAADTKSKPSPNAYFEQFKEEEVSPRSER